MKALGQVGVSVSDFEKPLTGVIVSLRSKNAYNASCAAPDLNRVHSIYKYSLAAQITCYFNDSQSDAHNTYTFILPLT